MSQRRIRMGTVKQSLPSSNLKGVSSLIILSAAQTSRCPNRHRHQRLPPDSHKVGRAVPSPPPPSQYLRLLIFSLSRRPSMLEVRCSWIDCRPPTPESPRTPNFKSSTDNHALHRLGSPRESARHLPSSIPPSSAPLHPSQDPAGGHKGLPAVLVVKRGRRVEAVQPHHA